MCFRLAINGLGSIVEACDSAEDFLVGCLQDWADTGALVLYTQLQSVLLTARWQSQKMQYARRRQVGQ